MSDESHLESDRVINVRFSGNCLINSDGGGGGRNGIETGHLWGFPC